MIEYAEIEGIPETDTIRALERFYESIFGYVHLDKFEKKLREAVDLFSVLALHDAKIVGFKIGYRIEPQKYYSWIGGVDPQFRGRGIAAEMMRRQHAWCRQRGYEIIQTKTLNRFRSMLVLNLKTGFDITAVYRDQRDELKIVLEKSLSE